MTDKAIDAYFAEHDWSIVHRDERAPKPAGYLPYHDLPLSDWSRRALDGFDQGIYRHQRVAIERYLEGDNLAVTTSTASGKTLIFNVCALEELSKRPSARIIAVYPLKALASEQTERWKQLLAKAGIQAKVGRIDGGVQVSERARILKESRVLVMTPDIVHAWLLSSIQSPHVLDLLRNLALVVIDEAHTYSGVFGSNSAFLFRRLVHASAKLGGTVRFIASSATMSDAQDHLGRLTGSTFEIVGPELDSSPRSELLTFLVNPPKAGDILTVLSHLIAFAAARTDHQSITFVDSRKQTEYLAAIIDRRFADEGDEGEDINYDRLKDLQIYPYRSGYEEDDRQRIQRRLATGTLKGVVSTSALEMGIDLPYLSLGILHGMPRSATSFFQRVGRVGRRTKGVVIIVNNGSVVSESIFREPNRINSLPLIQSALYLHNQRIQYIHAMCLARQGGEDQIVSQSVGDESDKFSPAVSMPGDFTSLCNSERIGEISSELQAMKAQAGDDPHHTFPLRDLDQQFRVEYRQGPNVLSLGSLSHSQLMREAYPGAVYYYQTQAYRVTRVRKQQRTVDVRPERRYFTSPTFLPTLILPNLGSDNIYQSIRFGDLVVIECNLQVGEAVVGFKERRGGNEFEIHYPLDASLGYFHDTPKFQRYFFTSGVVLTHPSLGREHVRAATIAEIILEAFLMSLPFERQDISSGADKHRSTRGSVKEGERFACLFDQTYGSLRLTSHLIEVGVIRNVFAKALEIAQNDQNFELSYESLKAMEDMANAALCEPQPLGTSVQTTPEGQFVEVILPGSSGVNVQKDNEEFLVEGVFFSPQLGKLAYRGKHLSEKRRAETETWRAGATTVSVPVEFVRPLEGESKTGFYNIETGELVDRLPLAGEF